MNLLNHKYHQINMGGHIALLSLRISGLSELMFQSTWLSIQDYKSSLKNTNNEIVQLCEHSGHKRLEHTKSLMLKI